MNFNSFDHLLKNCKCLQFDLSLIFLRKLSYRWDQKTLGDHIRRQYYLVFRVFKETINQFHSI